MDLHMKEERHLVSKDHDLLREAEATEAVTKSRLDPQKAAEKRNGEPWYFTHS